MKAILTTLSTTLAIGAAGGAAAHTGHVGEVAGHDHWIAGAAIGVGIAVAAWGIVKGRRARKETAAAPENAEAEAKG